MLLVGIIILTINVTKAYHKCPIVEITEKHKKDVTSEDLEETPSKVFSDMFSNKSMWMGNSEVKK